MNSRLSRRALLCGLSWSLSAQQISKKKPKELPQAGEFVRLQDPVTETNLVRLTSLSSSSQLPAPSNRFISLRGRFLIFSSDRSGSFSPYLLDLRTGGVRQLAETTGLTSSSLCLDQSERALLFVENGTLKELQLSSKHIRTVAEGVSAFAIASSVTDLLIVRDGKLQRLPGDTLADNVQSAGMIRPGGEGCLFERSAAADSEFWYAPFSNPARPILLARGKVRFPFWAPDGNALFFLRDVQRSGGSFAEIWRSALSPGSEECLSATSQFAAFAPNGDASVFVGASRSKAQPTVVLLLRSSKRELTLCEHHATDAASVKPVFAPDSRRVYFQSDREGKPALYSINVELLVEPTTAS